MKIALIGECMIELSGEVMGQMKQSYGGDSLNTAVYLTRTSSSIADVHYVTVIGEDPLSKAMLKEWRNEGIKTDMVLTDPTRTCGMYMIHLDNEGERSFSYWRDNSAAKYLCRNYKYKTLLKALEQMDIVYLSGISLAILPPLDRGQFLHEMTLLANTGVKFVFDTNYRPKLWESKDAAKEAYSKMFAISDYALVTNDDERELWGDSSEHVTISRILNAGAKSVVVKLGKDGCLYSEQRSDEVTHTPAAVVEKVVDTTSAGDSFNAGFLSGLVAGDKPTTCCNRGHSFAGVVIQHKGAIIDKSLTDHLNWKL